MNEVMSEMLKSNPPKGGTAVFTMGPEHIEKMNEKMAPLEEEARVKYRDLATQLDRRYAARKKIPRYNRCELLPNHAYGFLHFSCDGCDANRSGEKRCLLPNGYSLL